MLHHAFSKVQHKFCIGRPNDSLMANRSNLSVGMVGNILPFSFFPRLKIL